MSADIFVVGQGLAGTLLGWELERANIEFTIADAGHDGAASAVAAGMLNPITGRRIVKSAGVDALLPLARRTYEEIGAAVGLSLWREMRVRRSFVDDRERRAVAAKQAELALYLGAIDADGFWIQGAAQVDVPALIGMMRERWRRQGRMREERINNVAEIPDGHLVIDCTGSAGALAGSFDFVPWRYSKGEILEIAVAGLEPALVLNAGHWVLPLSAGKAAVGATHEPGVTDIVPTAKGRSLLEASARALLNREFQVLQHRAGVRVNLPDKLPVVGWHSEKAGRGLINGLGAKGVLWAPALARQWVQHLKDDAPFDASVDVRRFW